MKRPNKERYMEIRKITLADIPENICVIQIPRDIQPGFLAGADAAEEWIRKMDRKVEGRWKHDRAVFEKYYC